MEDNWFDTVESLQGIADDQWSQLKLPMALVNAIKKRLSAVPKEDVMMIDTTTKPAKPEAPMSTLPVAARPAVKQEVVAAKEEAKQSELVDVALAELLSLRENDCSGDAQHRDTVKLLFTIVSNLISKPLEPQVRRFSKTNKTIQAKILAFPSAIRFLQLVRLSSSWS